LYRKQRKGGSFGAQGAAERPDEATEHDHEPHSQRLRSCSGKPDGERSEPKRPPKQSFQKLCAENCSATLFSFFCYCKSSFKKSSLEWG